MTRPVAAVVGASGDLGAALVEAFQAGGMRAVGISRNGPSGYACDATDVGAVQRTLARLEAEVGPPELAVFNVGTWLSGSVLDVSPDAVEAAWRQGCLAGFIFGQAAARGMAERGRGTLLFSGATASLRGSAGHVALAVVKAGLRMVAQSFARELGPRGVHVAHVIIDGHVETPRGGLPAADVTRAYLDLHRQPRGLGRMSWTSARGTSGSEEEAMAGLDLYSWQFCPFAQRARIALALKGAEYVTHEIDITKKPYAAASLALNPNGQVPTIVHDNRVLFESEVACEYIDEALPGPGLLPDDPYERGVSRLLIEYGRGTFIPTLYRLLLNQDEGRDEPLRAQALDAWRWLDERLAAMGSGGDYLFAEPTLADYAFGPFFQRWQAVEHYRYFELPGTDAYANVRRWRDGCLALPLVRDTAPDRDTIVKLYADYARGYAQAATAPGEPSAFDVAASPPESRPMPPRGLRRAMEWPDRSQGGAHA